MHERMKRYGYEYTGKICDNKKVNELTPPSRSRLSPRSQLFATEENKHTET